MAVMFLRIGHWRTSPEGNATYWMSLAGYRRMDASLNRGSAGRPYASPVPIPIDSDAIGRARYSRMRGMSVGREWATMGGTSGGRFHRYCACGGSAGRSGGRPEGGSIPIRTEDGRSLVLQRQLG